MSIKLIKKYIELSKNKHKSSDLETLHVTKKKPHYLDKGVLRDFYAWWDEADWPTYKGKYRLLPSNPVIGVSEDGDVINTLSDKLFKVYDNGGYACVPPGMVHRLVAECWVFNPNPTEYGTVRHVNDDKSEFTARDLIWGTHKQNMEDAVKNGKLGSQVSVNVLDMLTGKVTEYKAISLACDELGFNAKSLYSTLSGRPHCVYYNRWQFRLDGDTTPWVNQEEKAAKTITQVYDHATGEISTYDSLKKACKGSGKSQTLLTRLLNEGENVVRNGISARKASKSPWNKSWVHKTSTRGSGIKVTSPNGSVNVYSSLREANKHVPFDRKYISIALKKGGTYRGYKFENN